MAKILTKEERRDEMARCLRDGHRAIIAEADEWLPLADHVLGLCDYSSKTARDESAKLRDLLRRVMDADAHDDYTVREALPAALCAEVDAALEVGR